MEWPGNGIYPGNLVSNNKPSMIIISWHLDPWEQSSHQFNRASAQEKKLLLPAATAVVAALWWMGCEGFCAPTLLYYIYIYIIYIYLPCFNTVLLMMNFYIDMKITQIYILFTPTYMHIYMHITYVYVCVYVWFSRIYILAFLKPAHLCGWPYALG